MTDAASVTRTFPMVGTACRSAIIDDGLALMLKGAAIYREVVAADPKDIRARRNLALSHHRVGYTLIERTERYEEGAQYLTAGLAMLREMSDADPNNGDLSRVQAYTVMALGTARLKLDQPREAHGVV